MVTHELFSQKKGCLEGKLPVAEVERVFKGWAQLMTIAIIITPSAELAHERDSDTTGKRFVNLGFMLELRMLGLHGLQLDGDFFTRYIIDAETDVACGDGHECALELRIRRTKIFSSNTPRQ